MAQKQGLSLEAQIKAAAAECGITPEDARAFMATGAVGAKAWGDGKLMEKFTKFLELVGKLLPVILPIVGLEENTSAPPG